MREKCKVNIVLKIFYLEIKHTGEPSAIRSKLLNSLFGPKLCGSERYYDFRYFLALSVGCSIVNVHFQILKLFEKIKIKVFTFLVG